MKAREFCYWLQGHLELAGPASPIDVRQLEVIGRHLKMVGIHDSAAGGLAGSFCQWLEGLVDAQLGFEPPTGLSQKGRDRLQARLSEVFLREIDPSYPSGQWAALSLAHQAAPLPAPLRRRFHRAEISASVEEAMGSGVQRHDE